LNKNPIILSEIIRSRKTIYPPVYSEKSINKELIEKIIEAGTWAPNHGCTEPWHFTVFIDKSRVDLTKFLSQEYSKQFPGNLFNEKKLENIKTWPPMTPLIIAVGNEKNYKFKNPNY
jgi:nitroreductase